jgi:uncharacterized protein YeaO (DUF488 family)
VTAAPAPEPGEGVDPRISTGTVYRPPEVDRPRVLVMRRWPRGVAKTRVDEWLRELGPSAELLDRYRQGAGEIEWPEFEAAYLDEVAEQGELLDRLAGLASTSGVTLLCGSHWPCHRLPLARLVSARIEGV